MEVRIRALPVVIWTPLAAGMLAAGRAPSPFDGTWTLRPEFTTTCAAGDVAVELAVGRVHTRQTARDSLAISSDVAVSGGGMTYLAVHTFQLRLDPGAGRLGYSGPVSGSAQRAGVADTVTGTLRVRGRFHGPDTLVAQVEAAMSMKVYSPRGIASGSCSPVKTTIKAVRLVE